ncbi:MAG: hypothetical protein JWR26_94 [Pedosphaera sp.]|nr:hypothetical protein [Pedosphaera sp.]
MKTRQKLFRVGIGGVACVAFGIVAYTLLTRGPAYDLGLSRFDLAISGVTDVETLRAKAKAVADAYLAQHKAELTEVCGGTYELKSDTSLTHNIHSLGYRSCFYYHCWNIYLPYSMQPNSRSAYTYTVAVQLSDATKGNKHDPDKFRVLRAIVIDQEHLVARTLE